MVMFLLGMISGIALMIISAIVNMVLDKRYDKKQLERQVSLLKDTLKNERDERFKACVERDEALMKSLGILKEKES